MIVSFLSTLFNAPLEFIYWIKWHTAKTVIRIYNACHQSRFDLYDINAIGDPVKLGFVVPQVEKDLESPCPEQQLQEGVDEVVFYGTNSKSECLLIRIARGCNRISDAWIYLKLDNGKTYCLSKTAGYQQSSYGNSEIFSCDKLQMHYLSPMRKWRIFFCGMLKEISENGEESGDSLFVKFVFLWKASSDVYDCTLDTNPEGFADALAKSKWKGSVIPPIKELTEALNFYAQSGTITGTVSVNDGSDHELYLYGEKIRYLGKKASISGCRFTTVLGNIPLKGLNFHLSDVSVPYIFDNFQLGYIVDADGAMKYLKELDLSMESITAENEQRSFKANFSAGEQFEVAGSMSEPLRLNSSQGWVGSVELSFVEIEVGNKKGCGLFFSGEISMEPELTKSVLPASLPEFVPLTVLFTDELSYFQEISGGKGSSLGKLTQLSHQKKTFTVPKGLIVTTSSYSEFLTPDILDAIKYVENIAYGNEEGDLKQACSKVSNIMEEAVLPKTICRSIFDGLKEIFRDKVSKHKFAVRSSATGEDTESMSAAGQMDTFLGVQGLTEIFAAVKKCWASQFGYIAVEYKRRNGQVLNSPMAVVIQDMVASEVSGVMFTCDPVTNNPSVITITANYGLGETVVSGSVEPDTFILRRSDEDHAEVESVTIGSKLQKIIMQESGGTVVQKIEEESRNESCLTHKVAVKLGKLAIHIEKFYKSTRDIEWGISDDKIYILQSRPVTSAAAETDYEMKHEFDSPVRSENEYFSTANVGEVLPGATSPLAIDLLTKYFSNLMRRQALEKGYMDNLFKSKYFPKGSHPFYNHLMMTIVEMITRYGVDTPMAKGMMISIFGRILDDPEFLRIAREKMTGGGFQMSFKQILRQKWDLYMYDIGLQNIKRKVENYKLNFLKFKTAKETYSAILNSCSDFDYAGMKHSECSENSSNWNMTLFSILWEAKGSFDNEVYSDFARLLSFMSNVESANVPQALEEVAIQIAKDIDGGKFCSMTIKEAEEWLQTTTSPAGDKFRQFLKRHGHRCLREFDVRSITWAMDPKQVVKLLQNLTGAKKLEAKKEKESLDKILCELHVPLSFWNKLHLRFVTPNCHRGVRAREATKSIIIKVFDHWRQGYRRLGKLMVSEGRLPDEELVFFFTLEEIRDLLDTRSPSIISRASYRKKIFPILDNYKFPELMKGIPKPINEEEESADTYEFVADLTMTGIPVSQGVTRGFARVATSLEEAAELKPGEILITHSTDIGWSPYFPIVSGVVTELGGLISHGAVVSREYGLPCIVGVPGATKRFNTGDYVLLDGKKGILQRLPQPEN